MIGAGILALTRQIAKLAGSPFSLTFLAVALLTAFSAYSYIKLSNTYPSAGVSPYFFGTKNKCCVQEFCYYNIQGKYFSPYMN